MVANALTAGDKISETMRYTQNKVDDSAVPYEEHDMSCLTAARLLENF